MACTRLANDIVLVVHGRASPSDSEWLAYLRQMESWVVLCEQRAPAQLVFSLGGRPSGSQGVMAISVARRVARHSAPRAVLTQSRAARFCARLAAVFVDLGELRVFAWDDVEPALHFIGSDLRAEAVRQERARLLSAITL